MKKSRYVIVSGNQGKYSEIVNIFVLTQLKITAWHSMHCLLTLGNLMKMYWHYKVFFHTQTNVCLIIFFNELTFCQYVLSSYFTPIPEIYLFDYDDDDDDDDDL